MVLATRHRKLVLFLFLLITAFFGYNLTNVNFGHDLDDFFDKKEKVYLFNKEFFSHFPEGLPNSVMLGIKNEAPIDFELIQEVDSFANLLSKVPQIKEVYSITNQKLVLFSSLGKIPYQALNIDSESEFKSSFKDLDSLQDVKNKFISKDNESLLMYLSVGDSVSVDSLVQLKKITQELASQFSFEEIIYINGDHNNFLITEKIKTDSRRLLILAFSLIFIILLYFFRSWVGIAIPFAIVISSVIWIMGTIAAFGISINVLTIAIPVIVGVISLSDVIHIISRYSEEQTGDKIAKIRATKNDILKAIILTTLTTSFGFLSLANSNIQVFTEFSIFTAIGVFYAFFLAYFLLPILLYYTKNITLHNSLDQLTPRKIHKKWTLVFTGVFLALAVIGITRVKHNHFIYENMNQKDEITKVMKFIEQDMYGLRDLTVTAKVNDSNFSILDPQILSQLNDIELFIENNYGATIEVGLATAAKQINRALNGGFASHYYIPKDEYEARQVKSKLIKNANILRLKSYVSRKTNSTFIKTKVKDVGSNETFKLNDKLLAYAKEHTPQLDINFGGNAFIIDETNVNVSEGMIWNLFIIILIIFVIIAFIFKSFAIGFFSLFPNILPLIAITAVVGWLDFGMNIGTTIVYTIAFGIAVDDTIHFLGRYKIEIDKGVNNHQAITTTIKTSGGAIFLTTLILVVGFGVLITSNFHANYLTGLLVCVGLISALLCDLYLLPVILKWLGKNK